MLTRQDSLEFTCLLTFQGPMIHECMNRRAYEGTDRWNSIPNFAIDDALLSQR
jgi:hypothetical protein